MIANSLYIILRYNHLSGSICYAALPTPAEIYIYYI
jgi:hypothetical protein